MAENVYNELLYSMQSSFDASRHEGQFPTGQPYVYIDWNQRIIDLSVDFNPFLIEGDHYAARIWFCCDRYFDAIDLLDLTCVIEYVNPMGNARVAPVLVIDDKTDPDKLFFSWEVNGEAARLGAGKNDGKLQFVVRFFTIDPVTKKFLFNMGTQPCVANVMRGLNKADMSDINFGYPASDVEMLLSELSILKGMLETQSINWWDLEPEEEEMT